MEFDFIDIMNIKAISIRETKLTSVLGYWDAIDRSYPTYLEFTNSINKLMSIGVLKVYSLGKLTTFTNSLHKKMSIAEQANYFIKKPENLIVEVLNRQTTNQSYNKIQLTEDDYNSAIKDYYLNAIP